MPLNIEDYDSQVTDEDVDLDITSWVGAKDNLLQVADATYNRRDQQYGDSFSHHSQTAYLWSAYLDRHIRPEDVSVLFILDKIVRSKAGDKPDHWVDVAGYARVHASVMSSYERNEQLIEALHKYRQEQKAKRA